MKPKGNELFYIKMMCLQTFLFVFVCIYLDLFVFFVKSSKMK